MKTKQKGVTLLELILVLSLASVGTIMAFYDKQATFEQSQARVVGSTLFQYNNAVRASFAQNAAVAPGTQTGSAWLKNTSCGGPYPVGQEFLPCDFPSASSADPIDFGRLSLTTVVTATGAAPNRKITATTTTTPFTLYRSSTPLVRSDLSGMAAISAAAGLGTGYTTSSGGATPYTTSTDASFKSNPLDGRITMLASNVSASDIWLRTDGGNSMHADLKFDAVNPLDREITGASRVQNLVGQVLYLGSASGIAPVSGAGVIVDANAEIIGNLRVRNSLVVDNGATVTGNVSATGSVSASQNITAGLNMSAGQNITAGANVTAGSNVTAGGALLAQIFYDSNNTGYYVDPASWSNINNLQTVNISNSSTITSSGRIQTGEYLQIDGYAAEGGGCSPYGLVGRAADGKMLSCQAGIWRGAGIQGSYTYIGTYIGAASIYSGSKAQIVMVSGGYSAGCGGDNSNRYSLMAIVQGSAVAYASNANNEYSKSTSITFGVPANTTYNLQSTPYGCGTTGVMTVWAFNL